MMFMSAVCEYSLALSVAVLVQAKNIKPEKPD